jgi:two-component system, chemotaxis family, protein-glutamate methylesterase/glutaminase
LIEKIRIAAQSHPQGERGQFVIEPLRASNEFVKFTIPNIDHSLIAIGASTGGPNAVANLLRELPPDCPPILVAIHMPMPFTLLYAERINKLCKLNVVHANNGDVLSRGTVYIAPGDQHMSVHRRQPGLTNKPTYSLQLHKPTKKDLIKPSVDALFESVAMAAGQNALVCVLTGMGKDGTAGTIAIHQSGGTVFAQDENSSVIYGMPKAAKNEGHVDSQLDLKDFPKAISQYLQQARPKQLQEISK